MKLYHGSIVEVSEPKIIVSAVVRTLDFGTGFYTTTDLEQARRWTKVRQNRLHQKTGYVSMYDTDDNLLQKPWLKILSFPSATYDWLNFVTANRTTPDLSFDYDIVAGPVANDNVYTVLTLFELGQLNADETIHRLKTYQLVNQILFHTETALKELRFVRSEKTE